MRKLRHDEEQRLRDERDQQTMEKRQKKDMEKMMSRQEQDDAKARRRAREDAEEEAFRAREDDEEARKRKDKDGIEQQLRRQIDKELRAKYDEEDEAENHLRDIKDNEIIKFKEQLGINDGIGAEPKKKIKTKEEKRLDASFADDESKITTFLQGELDPKVSVEYFKKNQQSLEYSISAPHAKSPIKAVKSKLAQ